MSKTKNLFRDHGPDTYILSTDLYSGQGSHEKSIHPF